MYGIGEGSKDIDEKCTVGEQRKDVDKAYSPTFDHACTALDKGSHK
jgi:hypothetical protein